MEWTFYHRSKKSYGEIIAMKSLADLLLLGNPLLYKVSDPVLESELKLIPEWIADLDNVMQEIRAKYHFGRAIAAPQLGVMKRLIFINIDKPVVLINPEFTYQSDELIEVWDNCMSFPNLLVKVKRYKQCIIRYLDERWHTNEWEVDDDISELVQHEYDHLDGVLCTMRAIDEKSFRWMAT